MITRQITCFTAADLEAVVNTEYESALIDLRPRNMGPLYSVLMKVQTTLDGTSADAAIKLYAKIYEKDGASLIDEVDLLTGIDVNAASSLSRFFCGPGIPADGIDTAAGAAVGAIAQACLCARFAKFGIQITTAETGSPTSNLATGFVVISNEEAQQ